MQLAVSRLLLFLRKSSVHGEGCFNKRLKLDARKARILAVSFCPNKI